MLDRLCCIRDLGYIFVIRIYNCTNNAIIWNRITTPPKTIVTISGLVGRPTFLNILSLKSVINIITEKTIEAMKLIIRPKLKESISTESSITNRAGIVDSETIV